MLFFIFLILILIILVIAFIIKQDVLFKKYNNLLDEINCFYLELNNFNNKYITKEDINDFKEKYKKIFFKFPKDNFLLKLKKFKNLNRFLEEYSNLDNIFELKNEEYIKQELINSDVLLSNIDGKSLDSQQRRAVIVDEEIDLVLAGAGSGKTLTIAGKVKYLCEKKNIDPKDIILISFTNKAAEELTERVNNKLGIDIFATTFHKLGLDIIKENSNTSFDIYNELDKFLEDYFENNLKNNKQIKDLLEYFAYYLEIPENYDNYKNIGDLYEKEKHLDFETIKSKCDREKYLNNTVNEKRITKTSISGERVKSLEEVSIANFLFLNGIEYEYESLYPFDHNKNDKKKYRPDFYLPEYGIYIEHFGINENGQAPWLSKIKEKEYVDGIVWKREMHKNNNTKLVETYSYYSKDGILLEKLQEKLIENGVVFKEVDYYSIFNAAYPTLGDKYFKEFIKLCATYITLYKSKNLTLNDLDLLYKSDKSNIKFINERRRKFYRIIKPIIEKYEHFLRQNNMIDFSDMINKATKYLEKDKNRQYKYIIIDEFQDVSYAKMNLIKALKDNGKSKLFCVGDDWQSIYRFAGSDVSLLYNCEKYYGNTSILKIENTYRNSQELINVASEFVQKNPKQINKKLKSKKRIDYPINIIMNNDKAKALNNIIGKIINEFGESKSILILGRTQNDIETLTASNLFKLDKYGCLKIEKNTNKLTYIKNNNLDIKFLTVHKSKGLEADNVILINFENETLGFPNKISDDQLVEEILSESDPYKYAEERRLFYVALTRTKNKIYILANSRSPSEFYYELKNNQNVKVIGDGEYTGINCPECGSGELIKRKDQNGREFLGCSNYPRCTYSINNIDIVKNSKRCPNCGGFLIKRKGKFGDFWGCTNYPKCVYTKDIKK